MMDKPNLYILGAAKAGTTTLYDVLRQHPQVFLTFDKEPMFFSRDDHYARGFDWYLNIFYTDSGEFPIRGEASPHYLYWADKVAPRIYEHYGNTPVKFIVILRNPITRAYSWYWNMLADGWENLSFIDALHMEKERRKENGEELEFYGSMRYGYLRGGSYVSQIKTFLHFFPREQILFLLQDDLKQDFDNAIKKVCNFLEISSEFDIIPGKRNQAGMPRFRSMQKVIRRPSVVKDLIKSFVPYPFWHKIKMFLLRSNLKYQQYPSMDNDAYKFLVEYFQDDIRELSTILGRDLSVWSE